MNRERMAFPLAVLLLFGLLAGWGILSLRMAEQAFLERTAGLTALVSQRAPELEAAFVAAVKRNIPSPEGWAVLERYGYSRGESLLLRGVDYVGAVLAAGAVTAVLAAAYALYRRRVFVRQRARIAQLTDYVREINLGDYRLRPEVAEDMLSPLEDEIYKTVVLLRESREQASAARQSLADNLADIAHQLKTPLSSITLLADLLLTRLQGEEAAYAGQIAGQAQRMRELAAALLTLSRIDAGTLELEQKPVDTAELCACAAETVAPLLAHKRQSLHLPETSASYRGDLAWSIQILANLLKNCSEHTPEGGHITVTCEENPLYTALVVEDDGPGIPPGDLPHLFRRFYRGQNAAKDSAGLGLALARALAEAQNGQLTAENRPEGGARFTLKFYH